MPPSKKNQKKSQQTSKQSSKLSTPQPPGTPLELLPTKPLGTIVVGINFGQTASSIALLNKDRTAHCIANDDGERQIPSVISFSESQTYVGSPARLQLIRNQANTIVGFRNLLGKSYDELKSVKPLYNSAAITNKDGEPAYLIQPYALEGSSDASMEQVMTVTEVAAKYLDTLLKYAQDFIGRKPDAAVLSVPESFGDKQIAVLREIVQNQLGVKILQFITEASASALAADLGNTRSNQPSPDANLLILDVGGSSSTATIFSRRNGILIPLASSSDPDLGGNQFEDQLMDYFVKEFNKKNKTTLDISDPKNHKSAIKLRLATEIAKKTLSASNSAHCSVESLFDGYDFSATINRMRCDLLLSKLYARIIKLVSETLSKSGLEKEQINQAILTGGSTKLPTIREKLVDALHPNLIVDFPIENDETVAIGCVLQADLIVQRYPLDSDDLESAFKPSLSSSYLEVQCLSKPIGLLLPAGKELGHHVVDGKQFVTLLDALTPLPVKKTFKFTELNPSNSTLPLDLWEGESYIKLITPELQNGATRRGDDDGEDAEEDSDDDEPQRILVIKPTTAIAHVDAENVQEGDQITITIFIDGNEGLVEVSCGKNEVHSQILKTTFTI